MTSTTLAAKSQSAATSSTAASSQTTPSATDAAALRASLENATREKIRAFLSGELTWAQVEGITYERARAIAEQGCELAGAGRLEEARIIFEGLVAINPRDSASHSALGTVYQKLGRTREALAEYDAAIAEDSKNPVALANRGELRLKRGDAGGVADLTDAVQSDPAGETSAARRARALLQLLVAAQAQTKA